MVISFSMKNVLSFKDKVVLDMTAIDDYDEHPSNLIKRDNGENLLKVATIYGANASGKSNLCDGLALFTWIVIESNNNADEQKKTAIQRYYEPFAISDDVDNSEYEIHLSIDGYEYTYGFEFNSEKIVEEWLYKENAKKKQSIIFERLENRIEFGKTIDKECQIYGKQLSKETLVLSFFNKLTLNTKEFKKVYNEISNIWSFREFFWEGADEIEEFLPKRIDEDKEEILTFLNAIDSGIKDIDYTKIGDDVSIVTYHEGEDGLLHELELFHESEGTLKSIKVYLFISIVIRGGDFVFIDEFNGKLHPLLLKYFIDLFYQEDSRAQLVYTTHDTALLDAKYFRKDQVLFVNKDKFGKSSLSSLSDFVERKDGESFADNYLAGVYGGIPILKDIILERVKR